MVRTLAWPIERLPNLLYELLSLQRQLTHHVRLL